MKGRTLPHRRRSPLRCDAFHCDLRSRCRIPLRCRPRCKHHCDCDAAMWGTYFEPIFIDLLTLIFFVVLDFLAFSFQGNPRFFERFCLFSKDFRGSPARTNPCCFCGFFLVFPKWQGKEDQGMGLFRGAVFHHGGVPENCPLALMGRFHSLMGRFPTLMGRCPECLNGPFSLLKIPWKTAH